MESLDHWCHICPIVLVTALEPVSSYLAAADHRTATISGKAGQGLFGSGRGERKEWGGVQESVKGQLSAAVTLPYTVPFLASIDFTGSPWRCTSQRAGTGLNRPIEEAETYPKIRAQNFPGCFHDNHPISTAALAWGDSVRSGLWGSKL